MAKRRSAFLLLATLLLASCAAPASTVPPAATTEKPTATAPAVTAVAAPSRTPSPDTGCPLRRGVNIGNCLEAPQEGAWGMKAQQEWFAAVAEAGFDHVRIPVAWSAHTGKELPYAIDEVFLKRVDEVVGWALDAGLAVVMNMHHFAEYCEDPAGQRERLFAIWEQLAEHYKGMPETVLFEPLNEPNGNADRTFNNDVAELIRIIRKTNPDRWIVVDGVHWANLQNIGSLRLPEGEKRLIASVHMYEPFQFTHQGASWAAGSGAWLGTTWEGTDKEKKFVDDLLDLAESTGKKLDVPVYVGEFGAYGMADFESRVLWTDYIARQCEQRGMSWAYWELYSGFGVYDSGRKKFYDKLLGALIPGEDH